MKGTFTLGGDASVAAGPVGRHAEGATDVELKAEIYVITSYSIHYTKLYEPEISMDQTGWPGV